jgi:hypothetical protein
MPFPMFVAFQVADAEEHNVSASPGQGAWDEASGKQNSAI